MQIQRETGANPARSRHCDSEWKANMSLEMLLWEGADRDDLKSGDLLVLEYRNHTVNVRNYGKCFISLFVVSGGSS